MNKVLNYFIDKENVIITKKWQVILLGILFFFGIYAVGYWGFVYDPWIDELFLVKNIFYRSYNELLQPLEHGQVAPIGFLLLGKILINILGFKIWAVRLVPFFLYIGTIPLFFLICEKLKFTKETAIITALLFCFSNILIRYATEYKQYMADIFCCLLIITSALYFEKQKSNKNLWLYIIIGSIAIWFSNTAIILLTTVGVYHLYSHFVKNKEKNIKFLIPYIFWGISFIIYYLNFIYNHPSKEFMLAYWKNLNALPPDNLYSKEGLIYIKLTLYRLFFFNFKDIIDYAPIFNLINKNIIYPENSYLYHTPIFIFFIAGAISLLKKNKKILFLSITPIIIHLCLTFLNVYPFHYRLILYNKVLFIIIIAYGIIAIFKFLYKKLLKKNILFSLFLLLISINYINVIISTHTKAIKNTRACKTELFTYINDNINPNESIYLYRFETNVVASFFKTIHTNLKNKKYVTIPKNAIDFELKKGISWVIYYPGRGDYSPYLSSNQRNGGINKVFERLSFLEQKQYTILDFKNFDGAWFYKVEKK